MAELLQSIELQEEAGYYFWARFWKEPKADRCCYACFRFEDDRAETLDRNKRSPLGYECEAVPVGGVLQALTPEQVRQMIDDVNIQTDPG